MNFINAVPSHVTYNETHQSNPLRWKILYRVDGEDSYAYQTKEFKCKDFFNDIVSKYQGHPFMIFGFDTAKMRVNEEGVYVHLTNILDIETFLTNIESINVWADSDGFPAVECKHVDQTEKSCVILIPRKYFNSTYSISFLTYFIRVANVAVVVKNWASHPTKAVDNPFKNYYNKAMKQGFKPPLDSWFYAMKMHTDLNNPGKYEVHDNGVNSWFTSIECEA